MLEDENSSMYHWVSKTFKRAPMDVHFMCGTSFFRILKHPSGVIWITSFSRKTKQYRFAKKKIVINEDSK